jgi:hypothetical protein
MRAFMVALALGGLVSTGLGISPPALAPALPAPVSDPVSAPVPDRDARPLIQFAICLDTSGSMEGLIDSARQKLWAITNELALASPAPRLQVALLTYGNDGHNAESGWVAKHLDFTEDLDAVSELLFSFVTNGGTELVGRVLQAASTDLAWSADPKALRLVFVAGNESADQDGQVPYREVSAALVARDITVSSIYCGSAEDALSPAWREVALRGDGYFATIDQNQGTLTILTPFDTELTELGARLNATYIPYGAAGELGCSNQARQDWNATNLNPDAAAGRAVCKATSNYYCSWDLCDLVREKQIEIEKIVIADLPEGLRKLTITEVITLVNTNQARRTELQAKIHALDAERRAFIRAEMARRQLTEESAFDAAIRTAIRERARRKGFRFPDERQTEAQVGAPAEGAPADGKPLGPVGYFDEDC